MEHVKAQAAHYSKKHRHFILYSLIGFTGLAIDYLLFALGAKVLGLSVLVANFISISLAITNNFWLNSRYNFKKNDHLLKRFVLFYGVGLAGLVLSEALIVWFHYGLGLGDLVAKLLTLPPVVVFQFFFNKRFSFGNIEQTQRQLARVFLPWRQDSKE